jgi:protein O-mannosyl-transferase
MYPVVLLLFAWWRRGRIRLSDIRAVAPFFALSAILGAVALVLQSERAIAGAVIAVGGPASRAALVGLTAAFYVWKFLFPINLMPIYPRWDVDPPSLLQFLPWIGFAGLAWFLWRRRWNGALLCLAIYLVTLAPVSGVFTVSYMRLTWSMDHLAYLPLLGVIGALVGGLGLWLNPANRPATAVRATWALVAVLLVLLAAAGRDRAAGFSGMEGFWRGAVAGNPASPAAHYNLGLALAGQGRFPRAAEEFGEAARLDPSSVEAETNLANALSQSGRFAEAIPHYERSLRLNPDNAYTHYNLALALREEGRVDEARAELLAAARLTVASRHPAVAPGD